MLFRIEPSNHKFRKKDFSINRLLNEMYDYQ